MLTNAPSFAGSLTLVAPPVGVNLIDGPEYFSVSAGGFVDFSLNPEARSRVRALPGDDAMRVRKRIMAIGSITQQQFKGIIVGAGSLV